MSNSLRETANELSSKLVAIRVILKHPSTKEKVFVLLEGETDIRLFKKLFDLNCVEIESLNGKEKVIQALQKLQEEGYQQVIGIKDADFEHLEDTQTIENLFITDYHDMEVSMIESEALQSLICEYAHTQSNRLAFLKQEVYNIAINIGYLRWFNNRVGNNTLLFEGLNFGSFIQQGSEGLDFNQESFFETLLEHSRKKNANLSLTPQSLEEIIEDLKRLSIDKFQICCGHDLTKLIAKSFLKSFKGDEIEKNLRLAYSFEHFKKTQLYAFLMAWSTALGKILFQSKGNES